MACVILREKSTGDLIATMHPETYEDDCEIVGIDREPEEDEVWCPKRNCWKKDANAETRRCDRDWDRLPLRARKRIEVLEQKVNTMYSAMKDHGIID